jgi:peptidyl-prolyl cis-trans isomerase C
MRTLLLFVFLLAFGCTQNTEKIANKKILQVNDHSMTTKEFSHRLARRLKDLDALAAKDPQTVLKAKEEIVNTFVTQVITLDWARFQKVEVSENDLDSEVKKIRASYPDDLSFRKVLAQETISFSEWREQLRFTLIERAVFKKIDEQISEPGAQEIKSFYEDNKDDFKRKERIQLRQILVDEEAKAELLKSELKKSDFAELARKFSIAPESKNGGLVGWIEKGSVDFFDPLFALSQGQVSKIFKSPFGYHIARIEKKQAASISSLEEARPAIIRRMKAQKEQALYLALMDRLVRGAKVLKDNDLINSIRVDTTMGNE